MDDAPVIIDETVQLQRIFRDVRAALVRVAREAPELTPEERTKVEAILRDPGAAVGKAAP